MFVATVIKAAAKGDGQSIAARGYSRIAVSLVIFASFCLTAAAVCGAKVRWIMQAIMKLVGGTSSLGRTQEAQKGPTGTHSLGIGRKPSCLW